MSSPRTIEQHRAAVARLLEPLGSGRAVERLAVSTARMIAAPQAYRGRILAHDLVSSVDLPPFDNAQMDGFAVRAAELTGASPSAPIRLPVGRQINAGDGPAVLRAGHAVAIMTGAPLPAGADTVVPIERVTPPRFADIFPDPGAVRRADPGTGDAMSTAVAFDSAPQPDAFVRRRGSDLRAGGILLTAGSRLGAAQYGMIAGAGITHVPVLRPIRVLLISTGHEIREPGTPLGPGQIYDANSASLGHALLDSGCTAVAWACHSDDPAELLHIIDHAASTTDLIITVGGVSAGAREVVRDALGPLGVEFVSVAMQPGGPQGLGRLVPPGHDRPLPVVTFPGNPVSALVSFEFFVRPALRELAGMPRPRRTSSFAPLAEPVLSPAGKHQVRRGRLDAAGRVHLLGGPSSHLLHAYATSTVLVHLPEGLAEAAAGHPVEIWRIDD